MVFMMNAWENMEMQMSGNISQTFLIIYLLQPLLRARLEFYNASLFGFLDVLFDNFYYVLVGLLLAWWTIPIIGYTR